MGWLRKRFGEKSTYTGAGIVGAVGTMLAGPEYAAAGAQWLALLLGVYEFIRAERGDNA